MMFSNKVLAGILLFLGAAWSFMGIIVSEALYPGYHVTQVISDLGVGSTALIFNSSVIVFGILLIAAGFLLKKEGLDPWFCRLMALVGIGQMGVGFFPETMGVPHIVSAGIVFFFGGILAIMSYRVFPRPWAYISVVLGTITLVAIVLLEVKFYAGLGTGGMERMIAYPLLFWVFGSGAILMDPEKK
ncbi:MAG: hypothetical protein CVV32_06300 [Methanomicrobiales archaeon HGW-Methanomicrobiales-3]|jgi:hypothetical membrane protein|nr:MAG: hypothetical protein CVV32_06300 [Methanomicrobiales archaeon HGW-Methanomicrobiales-3]